MRAADHKGLNEQSGGSSSWSFVSSFVSFVVKIVFIGFWFTAGAANLFSQETEFTASVKPVVSVGETFTLTYTLNAQGVNFRGPRINGFTVLTGPNTSTTSSIRSINGRTSMSITYTFSYILQAIREGSFEIPAASVIVDGKPFQSNAVTISVQAGAAATRPSGQPGAPSGNQTTTGGEEQVASDDVFLKAYVSDAQPLQGEGIIVTYKLFTRVPIAQISISKLSSFQGFWSQNLLKDNERFPQYNQTIDGEQYVVAEIRKIALYPLKSGKLTIDPLEVECVAQVKRQTRQRTGDPFFDDFFNNSFFSSSYATVEKSLKSNPLNVQVKPLPQENKPADFGGAVGSFAFRSEIDRTTLKTNEPATLKFVVSGTGNIQLIEQLNVTFPPDFETYDPKVVSDFRTTASGVTGMQSFEYLIIPRKPGNFTINPVSFSYFDLAKRQYVTLSSPAYNLTVEKGTGDAGVTTYTGSNKEEIQYIGTDIRHIESQFVPLSRAGSQFVFSLSYFLLLLIPFLVFLTLLIILKKQRARRSDVLLMKNRKATRVARKRLKKAAEFLKGGKEDPFYEEISQALWGYLSDKFGIPRAELSMDSVREALTGKQVSDEILNRFVSTLNETEFARFAPGDKTLKMDEIYGKAMETIEKIERELK
ncbi:MAG: protein BatD [Bacteroidetes bacterium]|nr:MAG: protein BatD [Bacteroidota bacterium]